MFDFDCYDFDAWDRRVEEWILTSIFRPSSTYVIHLPPFETAKE